MARRQPAGQFAIAVSRDAALRRLAAAEVSGDLAERAGGITLARAALANRPGDGDLALALGRALRAQYRTTYDWQALDQALQVLQQAIVQSGSVPLGQLETELARGLLQLAEQQQVRGLAAVDDGEAMSPTDIVAEADRLAASALDRARGEAPKKADALQALGAVRLAQGRPEEAAVALAEAVRLSPGDTLAAVDLAIALATQNQPDDAGAAALLRAIAEDRLADAPRDAFEAARFHSFWAARRGEWHEAGEANTRALRARSVLRTHQGEHVRKREWLSEAGAIPSQGACAFVRAGEFARAAVTLDAGLALNQGDRLGITDHAPRRDHALPRAPAGEDLLMLAFDAHGGAAIAVSAEGNAVGALLPKADRRTLKDLQMPLYAAYREWTSRRSPSALASFTRELDSVLTWIGAGILEPALDLVKDATTTVTIITDGFLNLVPVHVAPVQGSPLLDRRPVRFAPTALTLSLLPERARRSHNAVLAVGVARAPDAEPLTYAELEARGIHAIRGGAALVGRDATRSAVEAAMTTAQIVHFACHAQAYADDPLLSSLLLADAPLTLGRLLALEMPNLQVVTLSACETAVRDFTAPEEMFSLAGGLLHAGAHGVAATLWAVGDRASLLLALRFHLECRSGRAPCQALRIAQLWLREVSVAELIDWLAKLGSDAEITELQDDLSLSDPDDQPFGLTSLWGCFAYFGN